jgi:hypothetical protein
MINISIFEAEQCHIVAVRSSRFSDLVGDKSPTTNLAFSFFIVPTRRRGNPVWAPRPLTRHRRRNGVISFPTPARLHQKKGKPTCFIFSALDFFPFGLTSERKITYYLLFLWGDSSVGRVIVISTIVNY